MAKCIYLHTAFGFVDWELTLTVLAVFKKAPSGLMPCSAKPKQDIYPVKNETRISNRGETIVLYVTNAIWKDNLELFPISF